MKSVFFLISHREILENVDHLVTLDLREPRDPLDQTDMPVMLAPMETL